MESGTIKFKNPATAFMLFLMIFVIGVSVVIELVVYLLIRNGMPREIFSSMWFLIFMQVIRFIVPLLIWLAITKDKFKRHMPNQPLDMLNLVYIFFISILAIPAMMLISGISSLFVNNDAAELLAGISGAGHSWIMMMLAIAVTPGIVEEVVFRGYIQSTTRGSIRKIAIFNGLLFGLMHLNLHQFMYTFLLGIFFAYMVYYTRSIWSAIFSHFLVNGINVSLMYWATQSYNYSAEVADQTFAQMMYDSFAGTDPEMAQRMYDMFYGVDITWIAIGMIGVIAIFATIGAMVLFNVFIKHNRQRNAEFDAAEGVDEESENVVNVESVITGENEVAPRFKIDWCLVAIVIIYIAFTIGSLMLV